MSDEEDHLACLTRINERGNLIADLAVSMVEGLGATTTTPDIEMAEALEYLVDAIAKLALGADNPRQMIEQVVLRLDSYPIEAIMRSQAVEGNRR